MDLLSILGAASIDLVLVLSARTILARPLVVPYWIDGPIVANRSAGVSWTTSAKPRVHVSDWRVNDEPWLWNWTEATQLYAAAPTAVAGLHEGLIFRGGVLPRLVAFAAARPHVLAELYTAPFAAEEFAPWTLLDLLGGSYATLLAPRSYPGLDVRPVRRGCAVAIRVLGYVYEYVFRAQAHAIRLRAAELDAADARRGQEQREAPT